MAGQQITQNMENQFKGQNKNIKFIKDPVSGVVRIINNEPVASGRDQV
jgi:hypothetical protein